MPKNLLIAMSVVLLNAHPGWAATFYETDTIQEFSVPTTGYYRITSWGAPGGSGFGPYAGLGTQVSGRFLLTSGEQLNVVVGGPGIGVADYGAGGGGGSWVYDATLLEVAGGGGGGPFYNNDPANVDGRGFGGSGMGGDAGDGQGGGGGGAGWLTNGGSGPPSLNAPNGMGGEGPSSFAGGITALFFGEYGCGSDPDEPCVYPATTGGYGGGGGAGYNGGGGGGGYSGGDGGAGETFGGSGGTSYAGPDSKNAFSLPGVSIFGKVTIEAVPEPASWALMLLGVGLLGGVARMRRAANLLKVLFEFAEDQIGI